MPTKMLSIQETYYDSLVSDLSELAGDVISNEMIHALAENILSQIDVGSPIAQHKGTRQLIKNLLPRLKASVFIDGVNPFK